MERSASEPAPDEEEDDAGGAVSEHKLTSDTRAEGGPLLKTAFDFFYTTDPSTTRALKLNKQRKKDWYLTETFREMKKQNGPPETMV